MIYVSYLLINNSSYTRVSQRLNKTYFDRCKPYLV